jgi:hypothetical protein
MNPRKGQLPAGSQNVSLPGENPELGAALRTDVLAYPALPFKPHQRLVYTGVPGVEPVGYLVLYLPAVAAARC